METGRGTREELATRRGDKTNVGEGSCSRNQVTDCD